MSSNSPPKDEPSSSPANSKEPIVAAPETKKAKMAYPQAPDEEWPSAWLMDDKDDEDQCLPHKRNPHVPVSVAELKKLGINYWKLDANAYKYPVKAVPWDPKDAVDPQLKALRDDRGRC